VAADRKLGGILCEARWTGDRPGWVVVGIGLNVANQIPLELASGAIRLIDLGGPDDPSAVEARVCDAVLAAGTRHGALSAEELAAFSSRDWLWGRRIAAPVTGIARGLQPDGRLVVAGDNGTEEAVLSPITVADLAQTRESH
jgi:biotin-(acetyl-CoA carboxylase) ligase